jgi:hypothetical protein
VVCTRHLIKMRLQPTDVNSLVNNATLYSYSTVRKNSRYLIWSRFGSIQFAMNIVIYNVNLITNLVVMIYTFLIFALIILINSCSNTHNTRDTTAMMRKEKRKKQKQINLFPPLFTPLLFYPFQLVCDFWLTKVPKSKINT